MDEYGKFDFGKRVPSFQQYKSVQLRSVQKNKRKRERFYLVFNAVTVKKIWEKFNMKLKSMLSSKRKILQVFQNTLIPRTKKFIDTYKIFKQNQSYNQHLIRVRDSFLEEFILFEEEDFFSQIKGVNIVDLADIIYQRLSFNKENQFYSELIGDDKNYFSLTFMEVSLTKGYDTIKSYDIQMQKDNFYHKSIVIDLQQGFKYSIGKFSTNNPSQSLRLI